MTMTLAEILNSVEQNLNFDNVQALARAVEELFEADKGSALTLLYMLQGELEALQNAATLTHVQLMSLQQSIIV